MGTASPAAATPSSGVRLLVLLGVAAAMVLRTPSLLLEPRFWAEEGALFFSFAWDHSWFETLTTPHLDYYQLLPLLATKAAAALVPLEAAPWVTTILALLVQLLPAALVLWSPSPVWGGLGRRTLAVLVILLVPPSSELWLTSLATQFHLALVSFLILVEEAETPLGRGGRWLRRGLLLLAGLDGALSSFLVPLHLRKAWRARSRETWVQAAVAFAGAVVQLAVAFASTGAGHLTSGLLSHRLQGLDPGILAALVWTHCLLGPLLGRTLLAEEAAHLLSKRLAGGDAVAWVGGLLVLGLLAWGLMTLARAPTRRRMAAAFALVTLLSVVSSLGDKRTFLHPGVGQRYFFAPTAMLGLLLLSALPAGLAALWHSRWSALGGGLLLLALLGGAVDFSSGLPSHAGWSRWPEEVAAFRAQPGHRLRIWPEPWTLLLVSERGDEGRARILGTGWSRPGGEAPTLSGDPPRLGGRLRLRITAALPEAQGALFLSLSLSPPTEIPDCPGALAYLPGDSSTVLFSRFTTDAGGSWSQEWPLPALDILEGAPFRFQAVVLQPDLQITNGLEMAPGR